VTDGLGVGLGEPLGDAPPEDGDGLAHGSNGFEGHGLGETVGETPGASAVVGAGPGDGVGSV